MNDLMRRMNERIHNERMDASSKATEIATQRMVDIVTIAFSNSLGWSGKKIYDFWSQTFEKYEKECHAAWDVTDLSAVRSGETMMAQSKIDERLKQICDKSGLPFYPWEERYPRMKSITEIENEAFKERGKK